MWPHTETDTDKAAIFNVKTFHLKPLKTQWQKRKKSKRNTAHGQRFDITNSFMSQLAFYTPVKGGGLKTRRKRWHLLKFHCIGKIYIIRHRGNTSNAQRSRYSRLWSVTGGRSRCVFDELKIRSFQQIKKKAEKQKESFLCNISVPRLKTRTFNKSLKCNQQIMCKNIKTLTHFTQYHFFSYTNFSSTQQKKR